LATPQKGVRGLWLIVFFVFVDKVHPHVQLLFLILLRLEHGFIVAFGLLFLGLLFVLQMLCERLLLIWLLPPLDINPDILVGGTTFLLLLFLLHGARLPSLLL